MVENGRKTKLIGILVAAVLVAGLVITILIVKGPDWFGNDEVEAIDAQAQMLVYEDGETVSRPVENLSDLIAEADGPIFIDFWAEWCGPCKLAAPFVESLAQEYEGNAQIVKVNIDEQPAIANAFQIQSIPTFMVIEEGEIKSAKMGYAEQLEPELRSMIDQRLQ